MNISLIVTDAGPLITLAVAAALDTLTLLGVKVIIPDMVKFEVTRHVDKPGAPELLAWLGVNKDSVLIGLTEEYEEFAMLLALNPALKTRNRGELAAAEILARELDTGAEGAILLFEDSDIKKTNFLVRIPDNVLIMSTSTYLHGLQRRQLIADANAILDRAVALRGKQVGDAYLAATEGAEDAARSWG